MKSRVKGALIFTVALLVIFVNPVSVFAANTPSKNDGKRILFISSYSYSWQSVPEQIAGLEEELGIDYVINYEFMDTKNTVYSENYKEFYDILKFKLNERDSYDAIVAGDDAALNFVMMYQDELFQNTPIVFEGIDNIENAIKTAENPWVTGIVEKVDYKVNMELAHKIFPDATKLVFIVDDSENGIGIQNQLKFYENEFSGYQVEYIDSGDYTREELEAKFEALDNTCITFCFSIGKRKDGAIYTEDERNQILQKYVNIPLFRVSSSALAKCNKILGGYVVSHEECGRKTGKILKEVFSENDISEIAVDLNTPQVYCFNAQTIKEFNLNKNIFPRDSVYLNREPSFFEIHYKQMIELATCLVFLMLIILLINSHRGRLKQEKLNKRLDAGNEELNRRNHELEAKNHELAEVSAYKSEFLSRISHDIRTPMNSIINLTNMLDEEIKDNYAAKLDLQKIKISNQFLLTLMNDILDMSCIEQKKIELYPEPYAYFEFLEYIKCTFEPLCKEKGISFELEKGSQDVDIMVDKKRFNQISFNLLTNAVKYTQEGGRICYRMLHREIENGILPCDIYVIDNGIGMTKEFQKKMYEPFAQEGRTFKTVEGTGLGLSIVKEIVDLLEATIDVESEENVGTTFHVHIDMVLAKETDKFCDDTKDAGSRLKGSHILVAEDHPLNQEIIKRILEKADINVTIKNNGKETLDEFEAHSDFYDAILMDIRMPVMDGLTAATEIRKSNHARSKKIPIIALTANAFVEDQEETRNAGMSAHLSKPIDIKKLYQTLEKYICV